MADPSIYPAVRIEEGGVVKTRSANLSPLMAAKARAHKGEVVNVCPFGCANKHLDQNGYCLHLVGFSADKETFEPMVRRGGGRRVVQVKRRVEPAGIDPATGETEYDEGDPQLEKVRPGDQLVRITTCYRVYREGSPEKKKETAKAS